MHGTNVGEKKERETEREREEGPFVDHTENGSVKTELLRPRGQKNKRHIKGDRNRGRKWSHSQIRNQVPTVT